MADFVAVIRRAVDNLADNTAENRAKVYDKARAAIRRQLEAVNPRPADEVIARQLDKLDLAIDEVESEHAEALPPQEEIDETEALMAELESMVEKSPVVTKPQAAPPPPPAPSSAPVAPPPAPSAYKPAAAKPAPQPAPQPVAQSAMAPKPAPVPPQPAPVAPQRDEAPLFDDEPMARPSAEDFSDEAHDAAFGLDRDDAGARGSRGRDRAAGRSGGIIAAILVVILAGVGYLGWAYSDTFVAMFSGPEQTTPIVVEDAANSGGTEGLAPADTTPEVVEADPATTQPEATTPGDQAADGQSEKFTQRLNADGTETDAGLPPSLDADNGVEGRSVAELTDTTPADESIAEESTADAAVPPDETVAPASQPLGVAQKMILYEERLGQQSLEVKEGTVVWSLITEPSDSGPDQQVIRGEINNPDTGLSALLTIRKNIDASLPASHLVEVVFALPPDFAGGSIDQLQRVSFKQTEADQGTPLIAVPAKITQDFYMVALNDLDEARRVNLELMRKRNWIDIPVVYATGRQALITLEKGTSGTEVFNQALDAWERGG